MQNELYSYVIQPHELRQALRAKSADILIKLMNRLTEYFVEFTSQGSHSEEHTVFNVLFFENVSNIGK